MTLHAGHGSHGPSELYRLQHENNRLRFLARAFLDEQTEANAGALRSALNEQLTEGPK